MYGQTEKQQIPLSEKHQRLLWSLRFSFEQCSRLSPYLEQTLLPNHAADYMGVLFTFPEAHALRTSPTLGQLESTAVVPGRGSFPTLRDVMQINRVKVVSVGSHNRWESGREGRNPCGWTNSASWNLRKAWHVMRNDKTLCSILAVKKTNQYAANHLQPILC